MERGEQMSERMTNPEIEDVLSSIRRLVSEDLRPARGAVRKPRLVLTPALRVVEAPSPPEPDPVPAGPEALEDRIAELESILARRMQEFEADEGDAFLPPAAGLGWPLAARNAGVDGPVAVRAGGTADPPDTSPVPVAVVEQDHPQITAPDLTAAEDPVHADPTPAEPANGEGLFDDPADVIDEEMLREIVRSVLREELQGPLGERITRNVRKLVRIEVHRALEASEMV
ncbi:MAG: hypothetical protein ACK4KW_10585 [Gemmobacter sp.]